MRESLVLKTRLKAGSYEESTSERTRYGRTLSFSFFGHEVDRRYRNTGTGSDANVIRRPEEETGLQKRRPRDALSGNRYPD